MAKHVKRRSQKAGLPPGSLVYTGDRVDAQTRITIVDYDEQEVQTREITSWAECPVIKDRPGVIWVDVSGISHVGNLEKLGECFKLHPLVLEDILNTDQRPKVEDYEDYLFIVLRTISSQPEVDEVVAEQVSLILGANFVLSFHENQGDLFKPIRDRIVTAKGRIRKGGPITWPTPSWTSSWTTISSPWSSFGDQVEFMEDEVVRQPVPTTLQTVHHLKNHMIILRRSLWPLREVIARWSAGSPPDPRRHLGIF